MLLSRTAYAYNERGQETSIAQLDVGTGETRITTRRYCEAADVALGDCPRAGLLLSVDGPRTDIGDITIYTYRMADHPDCVSAAPTCAWRKGDLWKVTDANGQVT